MSYPETQTHFDATVCMRIAFASYRRALLENWRESTRDKAYWAERLQQNNDAEICVARLMAAATEVQ